MSFTTYHAESKEWLKKPISPQMAFVRFEDGSSKWMKLGIKRSLTEDGLRCYKWETPENGVVLMGSIQDQE